MAQPVIQTSFHTGEWAPALNARVDLAKYHSGAALLRNFFVDYRGGASTRAGTKYILQCLRSDTATRLIAFQATFQLGYILEFGENYIRFFNNGAPVLEAALTITGATKASPCVLTIVAHGLNTGNWIYVAGVVGMTQLNGKYYRVTVVDADHVFLTALLDGSAINSTAYSTYTSGGTASRIYTISSPYLASELPLVKFAQNVNTLEMCHPNHPPYTLTLVSNNLWTIAATVFGPTVSAPGGVAVATTLAAGSVNYAYAVTSVDATGQESSPSTFATLASKTDLRSVAGTNTVSWSAATGAIRYNVYKTQPSYAGAVPSGMQAGFIGSTTSLSFIDTGVVAADFSQTPPLVQNPFSGGGVSTTTITLGGTYSATPTLTFSAAPAGGITATGFPIMAVGGISAIVSQGTNYQAGETIVISGGASLLINSVAFGGQITSISLVNGGSWVGPVPTNPLGVVSGSASGFGAQFNAVWTVSSITLVSPGTGYLVAPTITFSPGTATATATATIGSSNGNPTVPIYFQQRLALMGPTGNPQQFNMSQPGQYYNFDISNPIQDDDAIQGTLVSGQLNTIKAAVNMPSGLVVLCDRQAWVLSGGAAGAPITSADATAQPQAYNGCSDVPPIVSNYDILYVQAKGSVVRDLAYSIYTNIYTGTDISILSSHLFYGFTITGWAYAEEPFKTIWAIRSDGTLLSLTFLKEQELIGWAHSDTQGIFTSIATVTEQVSFGSVDAVYVVVQRSINGNTVNYIERMAERIFPNGAQDAWCVDAALQYNGSPATVFSGLEHLVGMSATGLADGVVVPATVVSAAGTVTLAGAASKVTLGLSYTCQLQTLQLDTGEPTIQGKRKKITAVTVRVDNTLGLEIGRTFDTLVPMKDLVVGNVGTMTNEVVTDLVTGDARTIVDPAWTPQGQFCIEQSNPLPATILGVIPEVAVGDTPK
jgi:hypothetical protein